MASITTADNYTPLPTCPIPGNREPKQSFFPSDSYASRWIIQKVDPNYDAYRRQKWSIKSCIGHKCVCVYGVGCRIVALKSWYLLISVRYSGPSETTCLAVFGLETGMKRYGISQIRSQFTAHRTRPRQHTGKGPTCTKPFRMWNILCIPRETT